VVRHIADHVAVMYLGKVVEVGDAASVYDNPATRTGRRRVSRVDRCA
jgi:ABC-type oligopeptide transport system ATPase subunit